MSTARRLALVLLAGAAVAASALSTRARGDAHAARGRHASITQGLDCSACHTESGWEQLGAQAGGGFDHSRTGFPLTGRHRATPCTGCHASGVQISRDCASCHEDPHARRLGQDCSECHDAVSFGVRDALVKHRRTRLPLTGMHALLDCSECHRRSTDARFGGVPASCYSCHADDYRRGDIHPRHTGTPGDPTAPPFPTDCARCHRASAWSPAVIDPGQLRAALTRAALTAPPRHALIFPIDHGPHRGADCGDCHLDTRAPRLARCDGCHAHGPVRLREQHGRPVSSRARDCLSCHPGGAAR